MKHLNTKVIIGLSTIILFGCNSENGSSTTNQKSTKSMANTTPQLGQGYNSITGTLAPLECFKTPDKAISIDASQITAYSSVGQSITKDIFNFKFNFSGSYSSTAPFSSFDLKNDTSYSFASNQLANTISSFLYVTRAQDVNIKYQNISMPKYILNDVGTDVYNNDPSNFIAQCGDSLVTSVEYQASAIMRLDISSTDEDALYNLSNSFSGSASGNAAVAKYSANISSAMEQSVDNYGASFNLNYTGAVDGGGASTAILPKSSTCSKSDKTDCSAIIDSMNSNANDWNNSFKPIDSSKFSDIPSGSDMGMVYNGKIQTEKLADQGFKFPTPYAANDTINNLYKDVSKKYLTLLSRINQLNNYSQIIGASYPKLQDTIKATINKLNDTETAVKQQEEDANTVCSKVNTDTSDCVKALTDLSASLNNLASQQLFEIDQELSSTFIINVKNGDSAVTTMTFKPTYLEDGMYQNSAGTTQISVTNKSNNTSNTIAVSSLKQDDSLTSAPMLLNSDSSSSLYLGLYNDLLDSQYDQYTFDANVNPDLPLWNGSDSIVNSISYERLLTTSYDMFNLHNKYPGNVQLSQDIFFHKEDYVFVIADAASQKLPTPIYAYIWVLEDDGNLAEYALTSTDYDLNHAILVWKNDNADANSQHSSDVDGVYFSHHTGAIWIGAAGSTPTQGYHQVLFQPSDISNHFNYTLEFQNDGNFVIYNFGTHGVWGSNVVHPDVAGKTPTKINISDPTNLLYTAMK